MLGKRRGRGDSSGKGVREVQSVTEEAASASSPQEKTLQEKENTLSLDGQQRGGLGRGGIYTGSQSTGRSVYSQP